MSVETARPIPAEPGRRPALAEPPQALGPSGAPRRVGVEIEFAGLTARDAAALVCRLFGGTIEEVDPRRFRIHETRLGTFETELDSQYAHPKGDAPGDGGKAARLKAALRDRALLAFGDAASRWLPVEIVSPPVAWPDLGALDDVVDALRAEGAEGTRDRLIHAFALQLNPEVAVPDAEHILSVLRAYLLLESWLKTRIDVDSLRRVLGFASDFPRAYKALALQADYAPDLRRLMEDYATFNRTRNRGLDLWPLFAHLDGDRARCLIDEPLIKARPTFHYRLPDAHLSDPGWSVATEWNDWVLVEHLAADAPRLAAMADAWGRFMDTEGSEGRWAKEAAAWLG